MSASRWQRPELMPVGWLWSRFQIVGQDGRPDQIYQIRDLEESQKERALDIMKVVYLKEEPLCKALDILDEPSSIAKALKTWTFCMSQNVSLACFTEVDGQPQDMVGLDILYVLNKNDRTFKRISLKGSSGKAWKNVLATVLTVKNKLDVHKLYKIDKYLTSAGTVVVPGYRGQTIAANMLEARKSLCLTLNINVSAMVCTAIAAQKIAAECGYDLLMEFHYIGMVAQGIDLSACTTPSAKFMVIKYRSEENQ